MYIQLTFDETKNPADEFGSASQSIRLSGEPIIIDKLPEGLSANSRCVVEQEEDQPVKFNYYIDCEDANLATVKQAVENFIKNYRHDYAQRFVTSTTPKIIPAVILMKSELQQEQLKTQPIYSNEKDSGTGKLPNESSFRKMASNKFFLFGAAVTASVAVAATVYLSRRNE